jgi:geranylgeranyl diphosphate synthase type II
MYGEELAINAGDALHIIMWKMLGDVVRQLGKDIGWRIYDKMCAVLSTTTEGQYLELNWIRHNKIEISEEEYYDMVYRKAGYYTVIAPLQLGGIVAGVSDTELARIEEWGQPFGCAFQIWDDVMNLTVESEKQGKERGGDILEGKRTLILFHLLRNCTTAEQDEVRAVYSKPRDKKTPDERDRVLRLMEEYGSVDYGRKTARAFADRARNDFDKNTSHLPDTAAKSTIRAAIDFVVNREV